MEKRFPCDHGKTIHAVDNTRNTSVIIMPEMSADLNDVTFTD